MINIVALKKDSWIHNNSWLLILIVFVVAVSLFGSLDSFTGLARGRDGLIDLSDLGCLDRKDNDESNCGDNVCEGGESSSTCTQDCGMPVTECNDEVDNDNDGSVDLADAGCSDSSDNDESNCGDGVCEPHESSSSCTADCGIPDSCSDSDGGISPSIQGTVSGYDNGQQYSNTDACIDSKFLNENYCNGGVNPASATYDCGVFNNQTNQTGSCQSGRCA